VAYYYSGATRPHNEYFTGAALPNPPVFPLVKFSATSAESSNTTSHTLTLPATVAAGDLLLAIFCCDGAPSITWDNTTHGTWTELFESSQGTECTMNVWYKSAAGTEDAGTLAITTGASEKSQMYSAAIGNWDGTAAPAYGTATGTSANPDGPSLNPSGWDAQTNTLWITTYVEDNNADWSAYPAGWSLYRTKLDASDTAHVGFGLAAAHEATDSKDPGTFTTTLSDGWLNATIAIPGTVVGGGGAGIKMHAIYYARRRK